MVTSKDDVDFFFQEKGKHHLTAKGKKICANCPVKRECQEYSEITNSTYGLWGGELKRR